MAATSTATPECPNEVVHTAACARNDAHVHPYEDLEAWQRATDLATQAIDATRTLPATERIGSSPRSGVLLHPYPPISLKAQDGDPVPSSPASHRRRFGQRARDPRRDLTATPNARRGDSLGSHQRRNDRLPDGLQSRSFAWLSYLMDLTSQGAPKGWWRSESAVLDTRYSARMGLPARSGN